MDSLQEFVIEPPVTSFDACLSSPQCNGKDDIATVFEGYRSFFMKEGEKLTKGNKQRNHIVALLEGKAQFVMDGQTKLLHGGEMVLVSSNEDFTMRCDSDSHVLMYTFGALPVQVADYLARLYRSCPFYTGNGHAVLRLTEVLCDFAANTCKLLDSGLMTDWLSAQKGNEAFHLIVHSYDDVNVLSFFKRLICREQYFRNIVLKHCDEVKNIDELVERSGMCRTNFYKQFNREFGMSVHRWMQFRRARAVKESAAKPMMTVRQLMKEHHFSSPSNFIRFCRLYFGCTPNELIRKLRVGIPVREKLDACELH